MFDGNDELLARSQSRRSMLGRAAAVTAGAGLSLAAANRVFAQATPGAGASGDAIEFKNVEGVVIANLSVDSITDPFSAYNPAYPPPRGNRYIVLNVSVENLGTANLVFDPNSIFIQDVDNFIVYTSSVDLGPEPVVPAFTYQEIPPATTVTGAIGYVLVQGVEPARIFYAPARDRMALLTDLT